MSKKYLHVSNYDLYSWRNKLMSDSHCQRLWRQLYTIRVVEFHIISE